ncbi:MAG: CotH kinase family protein [Sphingobacteriaceae bacterium]
MIKKLPLYSLLIALLFIASCKKAQQPEVKSSLKEISDFKIELSLNKSTLKETLVGVITQDSITLTIADNIDRSHLIASFATNGAAVFIGNTEQKSGVTVNDFTKKISYTVKAADGSERSYALSVKLKIIVPEQKQGVPHLYIQTENSAPINSKDDYVKATLKVEGLGFYPDYTGTTKIKGRGNSTWNLPKKPYRLKLDAAATLLGLPAEKDWILLANYLDPTLMLNAVAMKTGQLLNMPYTNNIIPVDVTINGVYMGNYTFTEQKEVAPNRVDLEEGSVWLEMDAYFDEPYKFRSANYNLPMMVQYPDLAAAADAETVLGQIQTDFDEMESAVASPSFPNNNYLDFVDAPAMVNYLMVYTLCQNEEINHPKSTYLYKHKGGKYMMGEIWDFDWAFDFEDDNVYFNDYNKSLFWTGGKTKDGTRFFSRFMQDPVLQKLYKQQWIAFKANKLPALLKYLDDYAVLIAASQKKDYAVWNTGNGDFKGEVLKLRTWLQNRAMYMDNYVAGF